MTNVIIKGNRYRLIDNRSFELPLPLKFVVLKEDAEIAEYEVSADESVAYKILTKYKENMITPIRRPLTIADIYYFLSCRVFQDKTPFTGYELSQLGLDKYNVYTIIRKTRGITPYDTYWVRFDGDKCDYEQAKKNWDDLMSKTDNTRENASAPTESEIGLTGTMTASPNEPKSETTAASDAPETSDIADINEILHQQKVDVSAAIAEHAPPPEDEYSSTPKNSTMTADEIEQLLIKSGLAEAPAAEPAPASSGGNLSPDEIAKLFAANAAEETPAEPAPASSGGNLSPDEIAKLFAANATEDVAPAEPAPASSGGNLSPDEIAMLFAANAADETHAENAPPASTPEPAPASSGGSLSPDEIAKLFAANAAEETPAEDVPPAAEPAPASSGGNLSPDEIAKLFAANAAEETHAEDAPPAEPAPANGGKMSQEDIEKMLADQVNAVKEPIDINAPTYAPADSEGGDRLSPEEIEALLGGMKKDAQT